MPGGWSKLAVSPGRNSLCAQQQNRQALGEPCEPVVGTWAEAFPLTPDPQTGQDPRGEGTGVIYMPSGHSGRRRGNVVSSRKHGLHRDTPILGLNEIAWWLKTLGPRLMTRVWTPRHI